MYDIDAIDWSKYQLEDMPRWLRGISSNDSTERTEAYNELYDHVVDAPNEVSPIVLQFVLQAVNQPEMPDKDSALMLILHLISEIDPVILNSAEPNTAKEKLKIVVDNIDILLSMINTYTNTILHIFGSLERRGLVVLPKLWDAQTKVQIPMYRAGLLGIIGNMVSRLEDSVLKESYIEKLYHIFKENESSSEDPYIRYRTASALVKLLGSQAPEEAITEFGNYLKFTKNSVAGLDRIYALAPKTAVQLLCETLAVRHKEYDILELLMTLLDVAFGVYMNRKRLHYSLRKIDRFYTFYAVSSQTQKPKPIPASELNPLQRRAIQCIVASPEINALNMNLFGWYGLPDDVEEMRRMLN